MKTYATPTHTCRKCGKLCFTTRKAARNSMRKVAPSEQNKMHVYQCGEFFHFGHKPWVVARGQVDRRDI